MKRPLSKRDYKKAFSKKSKTQLIKELEKVIPDKHVRKEIISITRSLHLEKWKNISET